MREQLYAQDVAAMDRLGVGLAGALKSCGAVVYLQGELGAGKTTLVRSIARGLGITGRVRSPTYTLVEGYELPDGMLYHLDLYRLSSTEELEYLGIRDLESTANRVFIEWPERVAAGSLPAADLALSLEVEGEGRAISVHALTTRGEGLLSDWLGKLHDDIRTQAGADGTNSNLSL